MSKHETRWTRHYWEKNWKDKGGTLIEEFPAVCPGGNSQIGPRCLDGVIVLDGQSKHLTTEDGLKVNRKILRKPKNDSLNEVTIKGREIIIVQTKMGSIQEDKPERYKPYRLGMYLLGQALFSKHLMEPFQPKGNIKSVAICARGDTIMKELAEKYEIDVGVYTPRLHTPPS